MIAVTEKGEVSRLKAWLLVLVALLDDIAGIALVFIVLRILNVKVPWLAGIISGLALGLVIFMIHRAAAPSLRRRKVTGAEAMIGLTGKVIQPLRTQGLIKIKDEYWKAKSINGEIGAGEEVEVMGMNGLVLEVKKKR